MEKKEKMFSLKQSQTLQDKYDKNTDLSSNISILFEKHFAISNVQQDTQMYVLPEVGSMFTQPPWRLNKLQKIKRDLNEVKGRLNNFNLSKWQQHTNRMNEAGEIIPTVRENIQAELVTQAWCKFYEIASNFSLVPLNEIYHEVDGKNFKSVHLCEAPGAFVTALNHWLKTNASDVQWNWLATTLNPYCEGNSYDRMVADDRFIRHTLKHWCFGADNTGDIMDLKNLDTLMKKSESLDGKGRILLVTADGSIDCMNMPGEQESAVAQLHLCETVACLHLLQKGGNFLLKLFTLFEHQSVCLMYLLSCAFQQVSVTKPASSKGGNSEMYVVCMNFKGKDYIAPYLCTLKYYYGNVPPVNAMFNLRDIPDGFLRRIEQCCKFFKFHQCRIIEDNIRTFHKRDNFYNHFSTSFVKRMISIKYLKDYRLRKIDPTDKIVGQEIIEKNNQFMNKKLHIDSYNDRCKSQDLDPQERLLQVWNNMKEIEWPSEKFYVWHLQALPEALEIQTGKLFNKICSSHFCDSKITQILDKIDDVMQDMHTTVSFPPAEITTEFVQQIDPSYEILSFQFVQNYDSHWIITEIYDRLEKLESEKTLVLIGYSLLTQLNIGLLYLLGNSFNKIIVEIHDNEGYRLKLENYRRNEKVLEYLDEILVASHNAYKQNMAVWSIIPITVLYESNKFPMMMLLNHLMIERYTRHVINMMLDKKL
ncbi:PREDICTED: cap-specific mRNA (nucleoside-2'-O-)-methyltransferase 2 [Trachymyrmex cornetzi]|uniref:cap-specific mRNA (nucleoside-2'-O-)-methyltransferase 2 n=1 Tax=Trachymyrmex cornetzi TaxID=471704 RepID=UPI00084F50DD|nr:PREDICTED: cap-specific mRNA (nucleoside-2'-O-)-methyltransferase 2 [Trachymyrmex cornetzi]XP_018361382.1 PREDICTED: cap-specific mRNA (nucleoside-2'-O-)-methyltransferase 2 [Trachymyrmex cornetzi]